MKKNMPELGNASCSCVCGIQRWQKPLLFQLQWLLSETSAMRRSMKNAKPDPDFSYVTVSCFPSAVRAPFHSLSSFFLPTACISLFFFFLSWCWTKMYKEFCGAPHRHQPGSAVWPRLLLSHWSRRTLLRILMSLLNWSADGDIGLSVSHGARTQSRKGIILAKSRRSKWRRNVIFVTIHNPSTRFFWTRLCLMGKVTFHTTRTLFATFLANQIVAGLLSVL